MRTNQQHLAWLVGVSEVEVVSPTEQSLRFGLFVRACVRAFCLPSGIRAKSLNPPSPFSLFGRGAFSFPFPLPPEERQLCVGEGGRVHLCIQIKTNYRG